MINKLQFNNLVITNKTDINRARAQTIQKLVRKLRTLNGEKSEKDEAKAQTKQRRITICMDYIKKLKRLEIVQNVLLFEKNAAAVLASEQSLPEEFATAMLAMNKTMQKLIERFKHELNLKDSGKMKWRDEILATSRRREKIERTEQKRQKRKELKEQKAMARKRNDWVQANQFLKITNPIKTTESEQKSSVAVVEDDLSKKNTSNIVQKKLKKKLKNEVQKNNILRSEQKQNLSPVVQLVSDKEKSVCAEEPKVKKKKELQEITHEVDSFFFTSSGENYLSTAIGNDDNKKQNDKLAQTSMNHRKTKMRTVEPQRYKQMKQLNIEIPTDLNENSNNTLDVKDLHPSWAAKQKLKPVITAFRGKKIIFDKD